MKGYIVKQLKLFLGQVFMLGIVDAAWLAAGAFAAPAALKMMYALFIWGICPLLGGFLTVRAVLKGMQPYLALWAMALCPALVQSMVTGTAMDMGAVVAYAFIGLVCAAAGDELLRRRTPKK